MYAFLFRALRNVDTYVANKQKHTEEIHFNIY